MPGNEPEGAGMGPSREGEKEWSVRLYKEKLIDENARRYSPMTQDLLHKS